MLLVEKGDYMYMFTFDLKLGYHHIDISPTQLHVHVCVYKSTETASEILV